MRILVLDAQGGGIGRQLIMALREVLPQAMIMAVGTNAIATMAMLKAGADKAATGENAVLVALRAADVVVGPIGIVIADAMMGEVTPPMAKAIGQFEGKRVLIPFQNCNSYIVGVQEKNTGALVKEAVEIIQGIAEETMEKKV